MIDQDPEGLGRVELVADALRGHLAAPSPRTRQLLAQLEERLVKAGRSDDADAVLCRVAIQSALGPSGPGVGQRYEEVPRALRYFLELTKGLVQQDSAGLEHLLLAFVIPLAGLEITPVSDDHSKVIQVAARLTSLAQDPAAARELINARRADWPGEAVGEVIACALEVAADQPVGASLSGLRKEAGALAEDATLRAMTRERLRRALDGLPAETATLVSEAPGAQEPMDGFARSADVAQTLLERADYAGAELAARRLLQAPAQVRLIGENLTVLAQLHRGVLDGEQAAEQEIRRLAALAQLPEFAALEDRASAASPESMLREIVAHGLALGTAAGARTSARAAEAIAESRILHVGLSGRASALDDVADAMARTRSRILGADDWVRTVETGGMDVVHVTDLSIGSQSAVLAVTRVEPSGNASGYTVGLAGTSARIFRRLVADPASAETLTATDRRLLARAVFGRLDDVDQPLVIAAPRLWSLPIEALLPGARLALSHETWGRMRQLKRQQQGPLRVCFIGDETLPGAVLERDVLRNLAATGAVGLVESEDLSGVRDILTRADTVDVLVMALHGGGQGFTYAFESAGRQIPVHDFAGWRLPPVVVAANCSSGRIGTRLNLASLLSATAAALMVGLWDLSDNTTGNLLSRFYTSLAETSSVTKAWARLPDAAGLSGLRLLMGPTDTLPS